MAADPRPAPPVPGASDSESSSNRAAAEADREAAARIRAGDGRAFEAMFKAHYDALCRSVVTYVGSRDVAEDVVQGVFVRIWEGRSRWEVQGSLRHYLFAAVRRRAVSHFRHCAVRRRAASVLALEVAAPSRAPAETELEAEELRRRFERALATLPPRSREAFVLSRAEGMSYAEVALRMGISPKTVGVHIGRSLAVLRKAMSAVAIIIAALRGLT